MADFDLPMYFYGWEGRFDVFYPVYNDEDKSTVIESMKRDGVLHEYKWMSVKEIDVG